MARKYRKRVRAEAEAETRLRITEALVALHGSVGPARTTVSAVAERAGVRRATVYRHFPDEAAMFAACSAHWAACNPAPDLAAWSAIADPGRRLRVALRELYAFFAENEDMLGNTARDAPLVDALRPSVDAFRGYLRAATDVLAQGWGARGGRSRKLRAVLGHAAAFATWRSLVREQGLRAEDAVELLARLAQSAAAGDG